jgi:Na+-driven multidrug efflux pump
MVLAAIINAVSSPFIIFGLFGAPALGMTGAALSTVLARFIIVVLAIWWLRRAGLFTLESRLLKDFLPCIRQVLRYGAPAFAAQLVAPVGGAIVTRLLADAGPEAVAGFAVGSRIESLALIPFFALQTGVTPFVGQNVGASKDARLTHAEMSYWGFAALWGTAAAILLVSFGEDLGFLFTDTPAIAAITDHYLEAIALGLWGAGLLTVAIGFLNPLGYPNIALTLNALRYLALYAGFAVLLVLGLGDAPVESVFRAAWSSYAGAGLVAALCVHILLKRPNRKDLTPAQPKALGLSAPQPQAADRENSFL